MSEGLLIQVDGSIGLRSIKGINDISAAVGGDFDWTSQSDIICYCYEYALFELPVNPVATAIFWSHNGQSSPLAGPVLITGRADVDGNETSVPRDVIAEAARIKREMGPDRIREMAVKLTPEEIPQPQIIVIEPGGAE